jgi:hypothetical protein
MTDARLLADEEIDEHYARSSNYAGLLRAALATLVHQRGKLRRVRRVADKHEGHAPSECAAVASEVIAALDDAQAADLVVMTKVERRALVERAIEVGRQPVVTLGDKLVWPTVDDVIRGGAIYRLPTR